MARIQLDEGDSMQIQRAWNSTPEIGMAIGGFSKAVYEKASLPIREREVARMRIAQLNDCDI